MYQKLGEAETKAGERLEVGVVTAPDSTLSGEVHELLGHKGPEWREHIRSALDGETDALETRFYLGLLDGRPAANVMTVERHGVGILGHVFTRPEQRRKGIISQVMARQMDDFRARGGHALTLGTGFESPAYWIYHRFGFGNLVSGFMRYETEPGAYVEQEWFREAPASVAPAQWRHWPLVALLASYPATDIVRSVAWGLFGIGNLEHPFVSFMASRRRDPRLQCVMLEAEHGAITGCATLTRMPLWPGVWLLDVFAHPNYEDRLGDLIAALDLSPPKIVAFAGNNDTPRKRALERAGFGLSGSLQNWLPPWLVVLPSDSSDDPDQSDKQPSAGVRVYVKDTL